MTRSVLYCYYIVARDVFKLYCYYIVARDVFKLLATKYKKLDLIVGASFFEIYSGKVSVSGTLVLCCW